MNSLYEALQAHYGPDWLVLLSEDVRRENARVVNLSRFRDPAHSVVMVEAVADMAAIGKRLAALHSACPNDVLVLATWKNGITKGDRQALEVQGVTVLTFARAVEHA